MYSLSNDTLGGWGDLVLQDIKVYNPTYVCVCVCVGPHLSDT